MRFAQVLGAGTASLVGEIGERPALSVLGLYPAEAARLVALYAELPTDEDRAALLQVVTRMARD